jgi:Arc/MetJ-type ribon-helix-helix transcriptional regulator
MGRPKSREVRAKISVTIPKEQLAWLQLKVEERTFASVSHGVELCIREGQTKFGKPKAK